MKEEFQVQNGKQVRGTRETKPCLDTSTTIMSKSLVISVLHYKHGLNLNSFQKSRTKL